MRSFATALVLFVGSFLYASRSSRAQWQATLGIKQLDCSDGVVCRYAPHLDQQGTAAGGGHYRFVTNSLGFRGRDVAPERSDPDTIRVQLYGDSMVFSLGVDEGDTLADALHSALAAELPGRRIEVQNFGLPMNFLRSNLAAYREYGRRFRPDLVVFANPTAINPRDVNYRLIELRNSKLLTWLIRFDWGKWIVNHYQVGTMEWYLQGSAISRLHDQMNIVRQDQQERGLQVCFFHFFFDGFDSVDVLKGFLDRLTPSGLQYVIAASGMTMREYFRSPWPLPHDGHPTAAGHRYFAGIIAREVAPLLRQKQGGR